MNPNKTPSWRDLIAGTQNTSMIARSKELMPVIWSGHDIARYRFCPDHSAEDGEHSRQLREVMSWCMQERVPENMYVLIVGDQVEWGIDGACDTMEIPGDEPLLSKVATAIKHANQYVLDNGPVGSIK